jgi:hypothetical protein
MLTDSQHPSSPDQNTNRVFKNPLLYSSLVLGIALLAVGWIFLSRWQENRQIDQKQNEASAQHQRESDQRTLEQLGGKELAIQSFYATPGTIHRGEKSQLCYGVANAKIVKLEPQSSPVWPSYSRCVDVSPSKDTTYTLTIADAAGNTKTATLVLNVL